MRNKRKIRYLSVIAAFVLTAVLASCGRSDNTGTGGSSGGTGGGGGAVVAEPTPGPGFDGKTITLGVITPDTGSAAVIGKPLTAGNDTYFKALNAKGGIAGKYQVQLKVVDSKYEPPTGVQQYQATKSSVAMYLQILGTPIVDALKGQLAADGILAGPASLDAFWVRDPNLMPIGGPYQIQVINGIDYAIRNLDAKNKKICALTKADPYGETGLAGLDYAAQKNGFTVASKATFKAGDTDFTAQINQLQGAGCQILVLVSLPSETSPILQAAAGRQFEPTWLAQSPTWVSAFAASPLAPYMQKNFLLLSEGPEWGDVSVPGMKQMLDDVKAFAPTQAPDIYFGFGYNQARAAAQILEQAVKNGDLSQKGIVAAAQKVEKLTFGDMIGDYKYGKVEDRDPPRRTTVFAVDPAAPGGLKAKETSFASEAAKQFTFQK